MCVLCQRVGRQKKQNNKTSVIKTTTGCLLQSGKCPNNTNYCGVGCNGSKTCLTPNTARGMLPKIMPEHVLHDNSFANRLASCHKPECNALLPTIRHANQRLIDVFKFCHFEYSPPQGQAWTLLVGAHSLASSMSTKMGTAVWRLMLPVNWHCPQCRSPATQGQRKGGPSQHAVPAPHFRVRKLFSTSSYWKLKLRLS